MARELIVQLFAAGRVVPQPRASEGKQGVRIMAPAKHSIHGWRQTLKMLAQQQMMGRVPVTGPVRLEALFLFPRPKRLQKPHNINDVVLCDNDKGDWDNIGKAVSDAFNMVVWMDDCQVTTSFIRRRFAQMNEAPGVVVRVWRDRIPW